MASLAISLLGPFRVTLDGDLVSNWKSDKVRALLAYLAMGVEREHHRETLAGLLWPNLTDKAARSNLRYTLYSLRLSINDHKATPPYLLINRNTLRFNPAAGYWFDVLEFRRAFSAGLADLSNPEPWRRAVAFVCGPIMEGFVLDDCLAYEEWLAVQREVVGQELVVALGHLATAYEQQGRVPEAEQAVRHSLQLEPWDEATHRRLMCLLAADGRRAAAIAHYDRFRQMLVETLGAEPSEETARLYEKIRQGHAGPSFAVRPNSRPVFREEPPSLTPFVGFEQELSTLDNYLSRALDGRSSVVFVCGEAGSGKTTLLSEFGRRAMAAHGDLLQLAGGCNARLGLGDPFQPFREALSAVEPEGTASDSWAVQSSAHRRRLEVSRATINQLLAESGFNAVNWLLPLAHDEVSDSNQSDDSDRQGLDQIALFERATRFFRDLSQKQPLLMFLDDLQWSDTGTISLLFHLGRHLSGSRFLIVGAYRTEEVYPPGPGNGTGDGLRHPLVSVIHELKRLFGEIQIDLNDVDGRAFVNDYLDSQPNRLNKNFRKTLHYHTMGNPLFTTELVRDMQDRGQLLTDADGRWIARENLDWGRIPVKVEAVIAERFGRLSPFCQATLIAASVQGQSFIAEIVAEVKSANAATMVGCLSDILARQYSLVRARAYRRYGRRPVSLFSFRHHLFQQYAYGHLDVIARAGLHEATAVALEELYGDQAGKHALELAGHFEAAGLNYKAADYYEAAGRRAYLLSANDEAINCFRRGLKLLDVVPRGPDRDRRELNMLLAIGAPIRTLHGHAVPEAGQAYIRASELALRLGDSDRLFTALLLLHSYRSARAEYHSAAILGERLFALAGRSQDPLQFTQATFAQGFIDYCQGDFDNARSRFEGIPANKASAQYELLVSPIGRHVRINSMIHLAPTLWFLGYSDQALAQSQAAIQAAQGLDHPYSRAYALAVAGCKVAYFRGDHTQLAGQAQTLHKLAKENGFRHFIAWALCFEGFIRVCSARDDVASGFAADAEKGLSLLCEGLELYRETTQKANLALFTTMLVEGYLRTGRYEQGLSELDQLAGQAPEKDYLAAETARLRAELMLNMGASLASVESCCQKARRLAQDQASPALELRATTSLARLWSRHGKRQEAIALLSGIYNRFTEGFDTADIRKARNVLASLKDASRTV